MIVTTGAFQGQAQKRRAESVGAIRHIFHAELFRHAAALDLLRMKAIEGRGEDLFPAGAGQQIARELPENKGVVGQILIEGIDHPIAPRPDASVSIDLVPIGIGIAGDVQPLRGHPFPIGLSLQQVVHQGLVGPGRSIVKEGVNLRQRGWQSGQIKADTPNQALLGGLGREGLLSRLESGQDEGIDGCPDPILLLDCRNTRCADRFEGPVPVIGRAGPNPLGQAGLLLRGEEEIGCRRGHAIGGIGAINPAQHFALFDVTRHDGRDSAPGP